MRCEEVVSELAAPTPGRDRAAMAAHLADCSACAEWARRADRLDRLWEATRPSEPSAEAWDAVWANIAGSLPCPASARHDDATAYGPHPSLNGSVVKVLAHTAQAPAPASSGAGPGPRARSWRLAAVALVGLAQAAAVLVALGLAWQPPHSEAPPTDRPGIADNRDPAAPSTIRDPKAVKMDAEFDGTCLMVIRVERGTARVFNETPPEMNTSSGIDLLMFNAMESIATPQVAAR